MSNKQKIYKPTPISGFPEWTPEIRAVELQWLDHIRKVFESYGFANIETPAIEALDVIYAKGGDGEADVDKEIYVLERLQADPDDKKGAKYALHFDQTVPFARYVAQHYNELDFPFKRYQMQKVWRGERPQLGRSREFLQCDIDVIALDNLPLHFDAEIPSVIYEAMDGLGIGKFQISISNRKILLGLLASLKIEDPLPVTRLVDKMDKLPPKEIEKELSEYCGLNKEQISLIFDLAQIKSSASNISGLLRDFIARNDVIARSDSDVAIHTMNEGIDELIFVMDNLKHLPDHAVKADLSIVRGLDYYTGTVFETRLLDIPEFTGSVCSGGRYDDLASSYINKHLPGVGISIGLTRLFEVLHHYGYIKPSRKCPTDILVVMPSEDRRELTNETAKTLRDRGYNVEAFHSPAKLKRQLAYAEKKGIPYVWFPPFEDGLGHEVKDMRNGTQTSTELDSWKHSDS